MLRQTGRMTAVGSRLSACVRLSAVALAITLVFPAGVHSASAQDDQPSTAPRGVAACSDELDAAAACDWRAWNLREVGPGVYRVVDDGIRKLTRIQGVEVTPGGTVWVRRQVPGPRSEVFALGAPEEHRLVAQRLTLDRSGRPRTIGHKAGQDQSRVFDGERWRKAPIGFEDWAASRDDRAVSADGSRWRINLHCHPGASGQPPGKDCIGNFRRTVWQIGEPGTEHEEGDRDGRYYENTKFFGVSSPFSHKRKAGPLPMQIDASPDGAVWVSWSRADWAEIPRDRPQPIAVTEWWVGGADSTISGLIRTDMWLDTEALDGRLPVPWGERGDIRAAPDGKLWVTSVATRNGRAKGPDPLWEVSAWDGATWTVAANVGARTIDLTFGPDGTAWVDGLTRLDGSTPSSLELRDRRGRFVQPEDIAYHPDGSVWVTAGNRLYVTPLESGAPDEALP